jgi:hypothetical protein
MPSFANTDWMSDFRGRLGAYIAQRYIGMDIAGHEIIRLLPSIQRAIWVILGNRDAKHACD